VNGVSGGPVDTDALRLHPQYERLKKEGAARTPAGRLGTPEDLANVVLYLASEASDWIYGQTIVADGGLDLL
jgi:NAD(P)-dependent dehydrogenase (short-subunit alcohol dehydrogenase family)